jgi:polyhydroxybutyrate depolymerase
MGVPMRKFFYIATTFLFSSAALADTISVDGLQREYILDAPINAKAVPVIIALHGGGGSAAQLRRSIKLSYPANQNGIAVVYPNAIDRNWNDGRLNRRGKLVHRGDDLNFLTALVDQLIAKGIADPSRIVFTGISNGGMMSFKMACDSKVKIYGIVPVSANIPQPLNCAGVQTRLLHIVGTEDRFVPMAGGFVMGQARRGAVKSSADTISIFMDSNKCKSISGDYLSNNTEDGMKSSFAMGEGCNLSPVAQIIVEGGGHAWAGSRSKLEFITGKPTMDFSATQMIVNFTLAKPLK